jgi:ABC-2 type transport system ATP-binding protein
MDILSIKNLTKKINSEIILDNISLNIEQHKITGLLGPNGAGKTTLMRLITFLDVQDAGNIFYKGKKLNNKDLAFFGYMPEERALYANMKIFDQLMYITALHGISKEDSTMRIINGLSMFNLTEFKNRYISQLSKGQKQKVQLLSTILHQPDFLILDEPFDGLDPISYKLLETQLLRLKENGMTILFSSHRLEQVEHFCEQVIMINRGKKIIEGSVNQLKEIHANNIIEFTTSTPLSESLTSGFNIVYQKDKEIHVSFSTNIEKNKFINQLTESNTNIINVQQHQVSLKDIFIKVVNESDNNKTNI